MATQVIRADKIRTTDGKVVDLKDYKTVDSGVKYYKENDKGEKDYINSFQRENGDWTNDIYEARRQELAGKTSYRADGTVISYGKYGDPIRNTSTGVGSSGGYGSSNIMSEQQRLAELQKKNLLAGLDKAYNQNLSNIGAAKTSTTQNFNAAKNQANVQNKLAARNLKEYMANRGNSGENSQAQIMQSAGLQGAMATLSNSEQGALSELERQQVDLGNSYQSDRVAGEAGIDAQNLQAQIQLMQQEQARQDQLNALAQQQAWQQSQFGYQQTRDQLADSRYQQEFNLQNDPNNIANQIKALQLQQMQTENKYLEPSLQLQLANQKSIISNRNAGTASKTGSSTSGYSSSQGYSNPQLLQSDLTNYISSSKYTPDQKMAYIQKLQQQYAGNSAMLNVINAMRGQLADNLRYSRMG